MEKSLTLSDSTGKENKEIRVKIRKINNGFILTKRHEYVDKEGDWHYDSEEWYYEKDPTASEDSPIVAPEVDKMLGISKFF